MRTFPHGYPKHPFLILTASMGTGHIGVARELARRLTARGHACVVVDVLDALPYGAGTAIRGEYRLMLRYAPWSYERVYRRLSDPVAAPRTVAPVLGLLERSVARLVDAYEPAAVVSTFHLAATAAGRLRQRDSLDMPSLVVVTEYVAHRLWLHPGNDGFVCPTPAVAEHARADTGRPAIAPGPVVAPRFTTGRTAAPAAHFGLPGGQRAVLVSGGSWGTGDIERVARAVRDTGRHVPVILCGRNRRLLRRIRRHGFALALGWLPDLAPTLRGADALIDNGGGLTCSEAFATRLPVIAHRPLAGHGRAAAHELAHHGLIRWVRDPGELPAALDAGCTPGTSRDLRVARAARLFAGDAADELVTMTAQATEVPTGSARLLR